MSYLTRLSLVFIILCGFGRVSAAIPETRDLEYVGFDGQPISLTSVLGQGDWVVMEIWSTTCSICRANAHHMVDFARNYGGKGVKVVGVSVDGKARPDAARGYVKEFQIGFDTLLDDMRSTEKLFQRSLNADWRGVTPTFILFDPQGDAVGYNYGPIDGAMLVQLINKLGGKLG